MKHRHAFALPLLLLAAPATYAEEAGADTIVYLETFANDTKKPATLAAAGWRIALGDKAEDATNYQTFALTELPGDDQPVEPVAAGPDVPPTRAGYVLNFFGDTFWNRATLYWTTELSTEDVSNQTETPLTVSWLEAGSEALCPAVRVDNVWYVHLKTDVEAPGGDPYRIAETGKRRTVRFDEPGWHKLDFREGKALDTGTATEDGVPAGKLTGLGLFAPTKAGIQAFDSVKLTR
ncbi:MAG: hypothetical protein ACFCVE_04110 [Phycisphaerae bacterium]